MSREVIWAEEPIRQAYEDILSKKLSWVILEYETKECKKIIPTKTGLKISDFLFAMAGKELTMGYLRYNENTIFIHLISQRITDLKRVYALIHAKKAIAKFFPRCSMNISINSSSEISEEYILSELSGDSDRASNRSNSSISGTDNKIHVPISSASSTSSRRPDFAPPKPPTPVGKQQQQHHPHFNDMANQMQLDDLMGLTQPSPPTVEAGRFTMLATQQDLMKLMELSELPDIPPLNDFGSRMKSNTKPNPNPAAFEEDQSPKQAVKHNKRDSTFWENIKAAVGINTNLPEEAHHTAVTSDRKAASLDSISPTKRRSDYWMVQQQHPSLAHLNDFPQSPIKPIVTDQRNIAMPSKAKKLLIGASNYKKKAVSLGNIIIPDSDKAKKTSSSHLNSGGVNKILTSPSATRIPHPLSAEPLTASSPESSSSPVKEKGSSSKLSMMSPGINDLPALPNNEKFSKFHNNSSHDLSKKKNGVDLWVTHKSPQDSIAHKRYLKINNGFLTVLENDKELLPLFDINFNEKATSSLCSVNPETGLESLLIISKLGTHVFNAMENGVRFKDLMTTFKRSSY